MGISGKTLHIRLGGRAKRVKEKEPKQLFVESTKLLANTEKPLLLSSGERPSTTTAPDRK